jgi:hypothetical protein
MWSGLPDLLGIVAVLNSSWFRCRDSLTPPRATESPITREHRKRPPKTVISGPLPPIRKLEQRDLAGKGDLSGLEVLRVHSSQA